MRFLLLSTHYRSPIEYSEERLTEVAKSLQGFYRFFERYERITGTSFYHLPHFPAEQLESYIDGCRPNAAQEARFLRMQFRNYLDDDFNTGGAVGVLFEAVTALNKCIDDWKLEAGENREQVPILDAEVMVLRSMSYILGLFWAPPQEKTLGGGDELVSGLMQLLIDLRANLRAEAKGAAKDNPLKATLFAQTDVIRQRLAALGVTLEDRPAATTWRVG